jgi:putative serine protease PepD
MSTTLRPPDERLEPTEEPPPGGPGRGRLAAVLAVAVLAGGGAGAGVVAAASGGSSTTTTVVQPTTAAVADTSSSASGGLNAEALYASTSAGVVDITAKGITTSSAAAGPFGQGGGGGQAQATATGTGFVVDGDGHIVTAQHVVDGASSITVKFADGTTRTATVVGTDDATDVAVLKVDATGLTLHPLKLATSSVAVGQPIAAIGDPFDYTRSISTGIVSGVDRTIQAPNGFTVAHAIQTDAALNPGNSGGPLLNASGEVVGIVDQIATNGSAEQNSGVGFAVPVSIIRAELATLESGGTVHHAYLGTATSSASSVDGAAIGTVTAGGPAADAGLQTGDVITKFGGTTIASTNDLVAAVAAHHPGDKVDLTVRRGSTTRTVTVTLGTQPARSSTNG